MGAKHPVTATGTLNLVRVPMHQHYEESNVAFNGPMRVEMAAGKHLISSLTAPHLLPL
jgi:hypothetical protein